MSATGYTVDLRDICFVLFEQLKVQELDFEKYEDFDEEMYTSVLEEAEKVAAEVLWPVNGPGDRQGCRLDAEGNVKTPDGYPEAWKTISEGGWIGYASPAVPPTHSKCTHSRSMFYQLNCWRSIKIRDASRHLDEKKQRAQRLAQKNQGAACGQAA